MSASASHSSILEEVLRRGELIVCVGPELGRDTGLPSLAELTDTLLEEAQELGRELNEPQLRRWAERGRVLEALELLELQLGARFAQLVERQLSDRGRHVPPLAQAIADLSPRLRAVYTTGIDHVIERAFRDTWPSFALARPDLAQRRGLIFKLCGTLEFAETWVLTRAAFEREFGERSLRRALLTAAYRTHSLLFIGFDPSADLDDRLLALLGAGEDDRQRPHHFIALEDCGREQRSLLERRGLHVLDEAPLALLRALAPRPHAVPSRDPSLPACPYPGLAAFDASFSTVFHGRRAELSQAASRLGGPPSRHRRWLAIEGSSGVGKSSFVHAGLLPALQQGFVDGAPTRWAIISMRPGHQPFHTLVSELCTALRPGDRHTREAALAGLGLRISASQNISTNVAQLLIELAPTESVGVLVVVDQLEELITSASPREREQFVACIGLLLEHRLIYLITTMRADFGAAVLHHIPALGRLLNSSAERFTLAPISRVGLRLAIAEPAAQLDVAIEAELIERIVADSELHRRVPQRLDELARTSDATLPLVAHVLRGLWEVRVEGQGLTLADYEALGGISGALSRSADALLRDFSPRQLQRARALFLRMVDLDNEQLARRSIGRAEATDYLGGGSEAEQLLAQLSGSAGPRLLVVRSDGTEDLVDLVHEALLREWGTLRRWIATDRAQLARDEALARRARAWEASGSSWRSLPRGPERRALLRGRARGDQKSATLQREYQRAMRRAAWLRAGSWTLFVTALAGVVVLVTQSRRSLFDESQAKDEKLSKQDEEIDKKDKLLDERQNEVDLRKLREEISTALIEDDCRLAAESLLALYDDPALREDPGLAQDLESASIGCALYAGEPSVLVKDAGRSLSLAVPSDGGELWLMEGSGGIERLSPVNAEPFGIPKDERVRSGQALELAPDGHVYALVDNGNTTLWDRTGAFISRPQGKFPRFSRSSRQLVVRTSDVPKLKVYDSDDGAELWKREGVHTFAMDWRRIALAHADELVIHELESGEELHHIPLTKKLERLVFLDTTKALVGADANGYTRWELEGEGRIERDTLPLHLGHGTSPVLERSPTGDLLLRSANNGQLVLMDRKLTSLPQPPLPYDPPASDDDARRLRPRFSLDGAWAVAVNGLSTLELLASEGGEHARATVSLEGNNKLRDFVSVREALVAADEAGRVTQWKIDAAPRWRIHPGDAQITALTFDSHDPHDVYFGDSKGRIWSWDYRDDRAEELEQPERSLEGPVVALLAARGHLVALSSEGTVYRWRGRDPLAPLPSNCRPHDQPTATQGDTIICAEGGALRVSLDAEHWPKVAQYLVDPQVSVAFGGPDGLELWYAGASQRVIAGTKPTSLALDADGQLLLRGDNQGKLELWTVDGDRLREYSAGGNIEAVALSASGRLRAAGLTKPGVVHVWRGGVDRSLELPACPPRRSVETLSFSADEALLAAGCSDGSVHTWPLAVDVQLELVCHRLDAVDSLECRERFPTTSTD